MMHFHLPIVLLQGVVRSKSSNSSVNNDLFTLRTKMALISLLSLKCTVDLLIYVNLPDCGDHHHHPSYFLQKESKREREREKFANVSE